jgi:hypothetical protein
MIIILKKIAANTSEHHIEMFMDAALKASFFRVGGYIERISFWKYEIIQTRAIEYYALVDIEPDVVGKRVIKQLHKKQLNGKYIGLQEFHARHWSNDKRVFKSVVDRGKNNKRKMERRRKIIKTELTIRVDPRAENITISSHSGTWSDPERRGRRTL